MNPEDQNPAPQPGQQPLQPTQPSFPPIAPLPPVPDFQKPAPNTNLPPVDDPSTKVDNALTTMQDGEQKLFEVKRHPIGIINTYITIVAILFIGAFIILAAGPAVLSAIGLQTDQATQVGGIIFAALLIAAAIYGFIVTKVYWGNSWTVTSDSLTQITQTSLFNRQSSQLSLPDIEDVTAEQNGMLTHIFNYGVLKVETAGEHSKFQLIYCPNPNYYAQRILAAREALEPHTPSH